MSCWTTIFGRMRRRMKSFLDWRKISLREPPTALFGHESRGFRLPALLASLLAPARACPSWFSRRDFRRHDKLVDTLLLAGYRMIRSPMKSVFGVVDSGMLAQQGDRFKTSLLDHVDRSNIYLPWQDCVLYLPQKKVPAQPEQCTTSVAMLAKESCWLALLPFNLHCSFCSLFRLSFSLCSHTLNTAPFRVPFFLKTKPLTPPHQTPIIIHQHLRPWHNPPLHPCQKLQLQQRQLIQTHPAHPRIRLIRPKGITQPFTRHRRTADQKPMNRQTRYRECRV
jgi:hypothetical protein